ncbi:MAG: trehalose 6-phosphate synthase [Desulfovibrionaceae bacterium]
MPYAAIRRRTVATLKDFYDLMAATREVRAVAVAALSRGEAVLDGAAGSLRAALESLRGIPVSGGGPALLTPGGDAVPLDLGYEIGELEKDLVYLERGEAALLDQMRGLHQGFDHGVDAVRGLLHGLELRAFITDRDGTTNNYCGRYRSSIQSIYNAVFLSRFARARTVFPVFLTSAPLLDGGIADVSVNPPGAFIYAASKGREYLGLDGVRGHYPIDAAKQAALDALNDRVRALVAEPGHQTFALIGSGVQFKFGQTTVARQDIAGSVAPEASQAFLDRVRALVRGLDPEEATFRIEDTGLDIEVILTVASGAGGLKDFDKAEGVRFLAGALDMDLAHGPHLVCGDTGSDVPMLEAAMARCPDTRAVFVTRKAELAERVRATCPHAAIVPEPDMLVAGLGLAQGPDRRARGA